MTALEASAIFYGSYGIVKTWLQPKTKSSIANLAKLNMSISVKHTE
jgi:hypothetical protein